MTDATPDPLEAQAALAAHPHDDGRPAPIRSPHEVLADAHEDLSTTVTVLVSVLSAVIDVMIDAGLVPVEGRLTEVALEAACAEVEAAVAVDRVVGLTGRLAGAGLVEPLAAVLRRSE